MEYAQVERVEYFSEAWNLAKRFLNDKMITIILICELKKYNENYFNGRHSKMNFKS